jgi:Raf kinase inhibitor-like YbhB/YbcL family protein
MRTILLLCCVLPLLVARADEPFRVSSPAFESRAAIPAEYSRRGGNQSPPLAFGAIPAGAKSLALVMDDPDAPAGDWIHWLVANIPSTTAQLPAGKTPAGAVVGANSWGAARYDGPQPPSGTHRYMIRVYALDAVLALEAGFTQGQLADAMKGHVLTQAQIEGTFRSPR